MAPRTSVDREVFGVVFLLAFSYFFSGEIVLAFFAAVGHVQLAARHGVSLAADLIIMMITGLLKRRIGRADGDGPRLWGWWWAGFATVVAVDIARLTFIPEQELWIDAVSSTLYMIALTVLMMSSLNADPMTLFSSTRRATAPSDWLRVRAIVPLIIGNYAAYLGAATWTDYLNVDVSRTVSPEAAAQLAEQSWVDREDLLEKVCDGAVSPTYFEQMTGVIPLLLLTLGVEFGFFRATLREAAQRAATTVTVILMSVALVLALSTLPFPGDECGEILQSWHEYLAFMVCLQAVFAGLSTLVWLLVVNAPEASESRSRE